MKRPGALGRGQPAARRRGRAPCASKRSSAVAIPVVRPTAARAPCPPRRTPSRRRAAVARTWKSRIASPRRRFSWSGARADASAPRRFAARRAASASLACPCPSSPAPRVVTLRHASARPYDAAIAAARTCYSPRVIGAEEITPPQRETIGPLTFEGGHHTVCQHAHFEFGLENVSRQFVWSFLHSHPFYNSEQSSQRFVRLDEVRALVPEGLRRRGARASTRRRSSRPGRATAG